MLCGDIEHGDKAAGVERVVKHAVSNHAGVKRQDKAIATGHRLLDEMPPRAIVSLYDLIK
jgi:hypothetical protein